MASILRKALHQWKRSDPLLRLYVCTFFLVMVWCVAIAIVDFPFIVSRYFNLTDYIWMTKFFGMSYLLWLALVFLGFGLISSVASAIVFGLVTILFARVFLRAIRSPLRFHFVMCCAAIIGITLNIIIGPSLQAIFLHKFSTLIVGAPEFVWIPNIVEYVFGAILSLVMARKYIRNVSSRKQKEKPRSHSGLLATGDSVDGG